MNTLTSLVQRYPFVSFYILIFLLSWLIIAPLALNQPVAVGLIAFLPTPAAFIVAALIGQRKELIGRIKVWRVGSNWYLAAIGIPFLIHLMAAIISALMGSTLDIPIEQFLTFAVATIILATGEEIGWRGFAFPKLLDLYPLLPAALIFGVLHALFHLPMYLLPLPDELRQASPFWLFLVMVTSFAVFSFWLYRHTRGSVIIGILNHAAINLSVLLVSGTPKETIGWLLPDVWVVAAAVLIFASGMVRKPQMAAQ